MATPSTQKTLQIITLNGNVFLGNLTTKGDTSIISNSLCLGQVANVTKKNLSDYLCAENLNTLDKDVQVTGAGAMFSVRDLSDDLALELQILKLKFEQAVKSAPAKMVNAEFSRLIGDRG